jgi:hypothetical protein
MMDHGYLRYLPGDQVRLNLEIIKFTRMHVREAGVVFRHVEHEQSELTASGPPETIGGQSNVARLTLSIPALATPGLYRVNRMWVETYGGRRYDYEGEEVRTRQHARLQGGRGAGREATALAQLPPVASFPFLPSCLKEKSRNSGFTAFSEVYTAPVQRL